MFLALAPKRHRIVSKCRIGVERRFDTAIWGDLMSLSNDVRDAFSKPHGMHEFSEAHPVLTSLAVGGGFIAALMAATRYLFLVI